MSNPSKSPNQKPNPNPSKNQPESQTETPGENLTPGETSTTSTSAKNADDTEIAAILDKPADHDPGLDGKTETPRDEEGKEIPEPEGVIFLTESEFWEQFKKAHAYPAGIVPDVFSPLVLPERDSADMMEAVKLDGARAVSNRLYKICTRLGEDGLPTAPKWLQALATGETEGAFETLMIAGYVLGLSKSIMACATLAEQKIENLKREAEEHDGRGPG